MKLTEDEVDEFVSGKCMYLASAIHRLTGWEIQAVIEPADEHYPPWLGHAWCVDPTTGNCIDIDGAYPLERNPWVRDDNQMLTKLNELQLREVTEIGAGKNSSRDTWDLCVEQALPVAKEYVLPRLGST